MAQVGLPAPQSSPLLSRNRVGPTLGLFVSQQRRAPSVDPAERANARQIHWREASSHWYCSSGRFRKNSLQPSTLDRAHLTVHVRVQDQVTNFMRHRKAKPVFLLGIAESVLVHEDMRPLGGLRRVDENASLRSFLEQCLYTKQRRVAQIKGWNLGVM